MTQQPNPADPLYPDSAAPSYPTTPSYPSAQTPPPPSATDAPVWPQNPPPPSNPYPPAADQPTGAYQSAAAPMTPQQERTWGMLAHLIPLVCFVLSAGTLGFVASLVIYFMYKDRGPFVRANAANSLNIQIITGIGLLVSAILMLVLIGFITYPLICLWAIIVHIIAASKASAGEWYNPPMTPRIVR